MTPKNSPWVAANDYVTVHMVHDEEPSTTNVEEATYDGMSETDAKIEAAEARSETKLAHAIGSFNTTHAEIMGEFKTMNARLGAIENVTSGLRTNIWLAALAAVGLTIAAMAYGGDLFGLGMNTSEMIDAAVSRARAPTTP